jgi:hypothetical protein
MSLREIHFLRIKYRNKPNILPDIIIRNDIPHFFNASMEVVLLVKKDN